MGDRDRLIELFKKIEYTPFPEMTMTSNLGNQFTDYALNCIVDELLANGVIVPPCKVGNKVYCIEYNFGIIEEYTVYGYTTKSGKLALLVRSGIYTSVISEWFLTKEEAERAIKEREGK